MVLTGAQTIDDADVLRRPSAFSVLSTNNKKLDIRAHQRTYQGAYIRTTIGALSFAILILKLFSTEFLKIGVLYTIYGMVIFVISLVRLQSMDLYYLKEIRELTWQQQGHADDDELEDVVVYFKTSGNFILLLSTISLICYALLFYFIYNM